MLDINKIRDHKEEVKNALLKRLKPEDFDLDGVLALDVKRKQLLTEVEKLKAERNKNSKTKPTPEVIAQMKEIGERIKKLDIDVANVEEELKTKLSKEEFERKKMQEEMEKLKLRVEHTIFPNM